MPRENSPKRNKKKSQKKNSRRIARTESGSTSPARDVSTTRPSAGPSRRGGRSPPKQAARGAGRARVPEEAQRLQKVEKQIRELQKERELLRPKVAAMQPPELQLPEAGIKRNRGSQYTTWFKAEGSFSERKDWDTYAQMQGLLDEVEVDFEAPSAFYSNAIIGRVKFPGIVDREVLIGQLNDIGGWNGDFRDIYPRWQYTYRIVESIGGVPIAFYTHRAKQPLSKKDRARGWKAF